MPNNSGANPLTNVRKISKNDSSQMIDLDNLELEIILNEKLSFKPKFETDVEVFTAAGPSGIRPADHKEALNLENQ